MSPFFLIILAACSSPEGTLREGVEQFKGDDFVAALKTADEVVASWPDSKEAEGAKVLAAMAVGAQAHVAITAGDFDAAVSHVGEFTQRTGGEVRPIASQPYGPLSREPGSAPISCSSAECPYTIELPPVNKDDLALVERIAYFRGREGDSDAAQKALIEVGFDNAMSKSSAAATWAREQTCRVAAAWPGWGECKDLSASGSKLGEVLATMDQCDAFANLAVSGCDGPAAEVGNEVLGTVAEVNSTLATLERTSICALLPTTRIAFSPDTPKLEGKDLPSVPPMKWWSTFKGESDPVMSLRILAAMQLAAEPRYQALAKLFLDDLPKLGLTEVETKPAVYGCYYDDDWRREWVDASKYYCERAGFHEWKVRTPAVTGIKAPDVWPEAERQAAELTYFASFELMGVFNGFTQVMNQDLGFDMQVLIGYRASQSLPASLAKGEEAKKALEAACNDWVVP